MLVAGTFAWTGKLEPRAQKVWERMKVKFNLDNPGQLVLPSGTANAYDAIYIIAEALKQAGSFDRTKLRDALYKVLTRKCGMKGKACTHGFRSTFTNWAVDNKICDSRVAEAQLAHVIKDDTRSAYERTTQLAERARVMEAWAFYLHVSG